MDIMQTRFDCQPLVGRGASRAGFVGEKAESMSCAENKLFRIELNVGDISIFKIIGSIVSLCLDSRCLERRIVATQRVQRHLFRHLC